MGRTVKAQEIEEMRRLKKLGYSSKTIGKMLGYGEATVRKNTRHIKTNLNQI